MRKLSFEKACAQFVHRFTMEHIPAWALEPIDGKFYAPQFHSDKEWYDATKFNGEHELADRRHCYTSDQTWPLGQWLDWPVNRVLKAAAEYRPYNSMPAFWQGFIDYRNCAPGWTQSTTSTVEAQAYDRGAECAMRLGRDALHKVTPCEGAYLSINTDPSYAGKKVDIDAALEAIAKAVQ